MSVVSFVNYRPAPRYDSIAWIEASIEEGPTAEGPWTEIDVIVLDPVDADPTNPAVRNFTTTLATEDSGLWYRIVFVDAANNRLPTTPEFNGPPSAVVPTTREIRDASNVEFAEFKYPEPAAGLPDRLEGPLAEAVAEFQGKTGLDPADPTLVTDARLPLFRRAIRMLVEYNVAGSQMEVLESVADFDILQSFSAAGYSETRRSIGAGRAVIHPWPALAGLLGLINAYDSQGMPVNDGPMLRNLDLSRRPGEEIMGIKLNVGPFDSPQTVHVLGP